jgi:hypothetical protein
MLPSLSFSTTPPAAVPPDRLLLRWVKYNLRRATRHGFPYRRKFLNFRNDIRDGVSYAVLMNKIAPETTKVNLDGEIDPQLRIDTMLEQCGRLDPPCVGFITRGHILGFEPFLNCAFVTRKRDVVCLFVVVVIVAAVVVVVVVVVVHSAMHPIANKTEHPFLLHPFFSSPPPLPHRFISNKTWHVDW